MNCHEFHEGYIVLLDPDSAVTAARAELAEHLKTCRSCAQFYDEITRTVALLRPSTQVNASPQFKETVMDKIIEQEKMGHSTAQTRKLGRKKTWQLALAAGIAGLLVCGALLWIRFHSAGNGGVELPAFSLFRQACAAEESLFKSEGIISIVNEIIVKPISDPDLARLRFLPMNSLAPSGKLQTDMLALPAKSGEGYTVEDRAWYDRSTGRFARVMTVGGKSIFANSFDGTSVYRLEPDAAGVSKVVGKPVAADFQPPGSPAGFLGITAGLTGSSASLEKESNLSDAGQVTLPDGSAARVVKLTMGFLGTDKEVRELIGDTYWLFTIRKTSNTIAQAEMVLKGQSSLVIRRVMVAPAVAPEVPWNLAGIEVQPGGSQASTMPGINPNPKVNADMVLPNVSVQHMVEKADFEAYIFAADPPWASGREITDILDVTSPPQRMFAISYVAGDHRHVVLIQSPSYNKMMGQVTKTCSLAYTSPNGCKVWSGPQSKWGAGILLQSAQFVIKDPPAENRTGYILETLSGTFPALAINGPVTDAELHALIDSLIPAKEYLKKFPAPATTGAEKAGTTSP